MNTASTNPFISAQEACRLLRGGGVVAIPTETVYGLAANATNANAVDSIYRIKHRPPNNPLICHFASFAKAVPFLATYPGYVDALVRYFFPGPVSLLLPLKSGSPLSNAVRGQANVIVRVPAHPVALQILECVGEPLAAPSANTSGRFSPTNAQMVANDFNGLVKVVDGGASNAGIESTILDCTGATAVNILRPGSVGKGEIEQALANDGFDISVRYSNAVRPTPGHVHRHYAPRTPLKMVETIEALPYDLGNKAVLASAEAVTILALRYHEKPPLLISIGSERNPPEIGRQLYAALSKLDASPVTEAYVVQPFIRDADWQRALLYRLRKMTEPL